MLARMSALNDAAKWFSLEVAGRAAVTAAGRAVHSRLQPIAGPVDVFLCIVDHHEPQVGRPTQRVARERVEDWMRRYPQIVSRHRDADGRTPVHTFCYPWDEYDEWEFAHLAELCAAGCGEIELHLHHHDDTDFSLRRKFREAVATYHRFGALSQWPDGRVAFGFVHGNWALDNSRCDHGRNFCGVNNELTILRDEGCYADFTFPAWSQTAQPRQVNSIYYAKDDPTQPKSYDTGEPARVVRSPEDALLIVQGPLVPFVKRAGRGVRLAMDDGDLAAYRRYDPARLDRWVRAGIHVQGARERVFIKLHCHGAADANRAALLGEDLDALFTDAEARYNDGHRYRLHYVTAREMFNVIRATEAGAGGDMERIRNWILPAPAAVPCHP